MQDKEIKTVKAVVVSKSGNKSIKVAIESKVKHPKYGKYVKRVSTFGVHDEQNVSNIGDVVEVSQCRPYSKTISWRLVKVVKKSQEATI
ncbi:MAG: 30S ribosomal protein S17 [Planctomycetes bacterium]|nr:30S ribosomal protein S17 [Planctomycetota bacterium]